MLSRLFIETLKLWPEPQYKVAIRANVHPSLLSKWLIGAQKVNSGDPRLLKIGKILGLTPDEIFQDGNEMSL